MMGWSTRWPIEPTGPAIFTSASHFIAVPPSASLRWNAVSMFMIAPPPLPLHDSLAKSGSRSSSFSMLTFIFRPPRPSGTFTFAVQWRSSLMSKLSTPGIVFAIAVGSLSTRQTVSRGASNCFSPSTFTPSPLRSCIAGRQRRRTRGKPTRPEVGTASGASCVAHLHELAGLLGRLQHLPHTPVGIAAVVHDRLAAPAQRVLDRRADRVDTGAAALPHSLRPERREGGRGLDVAGLERRHVHRVWDVVVVEVRRQEIALFVVRERLVRRRAQCLRRRAHHLPLDHLRVDP